MLQVTQYHCLHNAAIKDSSRNFLMRTSSYLLSSPCARCINLRPHHYSRILSSFWPH